MYRVELPYFPHLFHWIENAFIFYWPSLVACLIASFLHCCFKSTQDGGPLLPVYDTVMIGLFVGFCAWIVFVALDNGYGCG
jgi:hypothetical protein